MAPFYGWSSADSRLQSHHEETVYALSLNFQKFLVSWTSKEWKDELTFEPPRFLTWDSWIGNPAP